MQKSNFLIYGSYGYTGKLITELACQKGLRPVIAGRNEAAVRKQAESLQLPYRVFDISNPEQIKSAISEFTAVIHCAGPFINTYRNMAKACLETNTHYLDITGEVSVIEGLAALDAAAKTAGIMLLPGAGFDVVPTDCLAQHLKARLPDAASLSLAIYSNCTLKDKSTTMSRGTAKTAIEHLSTGTLIRYQGKLTPIPYVQPKTFTFDNGKQKQCINFTWGDLASAWYSTNIPHIETYFVASKQFIKLSSLMRRFKFILNFKPIHSWLKQRASRLPDGPTPETQKHTHVEIIGIAKNSAGKSVESLLTTPEGYQFTALAVINIIQKVMAGNAPAGFQTPSTAYGKDLVLEIPGVHLNSR